MAAFGEGVTEEDAEHNGCRDHFVKHVMELDSAESSLFQVGLGSRDWVVESEELPALSQETRQGRGTRFLAESGDCWVLERLGTTNPVNKVQVSSLTSIDFVAGLLRLGGVAAAG